MITQLVDVEVALEVVLVVLLCAVVVVAEVDDVVVDVKTVVEDVWVIPVAEEEVAVAVEELELTTEVELNDESSDEVRPDVDDPLGMFPIPAGPMCNNRRPASPRTIATGTAPRASGSSLSGLFFILR